MSRILIKNVDVIVTMDSNRRILRGYDISLRDNQIEEIGKDLIVSAERVILGRHKIALPGFINTHHHLYQSLCRNIPRVQDVKLFDWLIDLYEVWRELTPEAVFVSTQVALGELMLTGCTTAADHFYVFPKNQSTDLIDVEVDAAKEIGMRFHPTRGSMSRGRSLGGLPPDDVVQKEDDIMKDCERLLNKIHDPSPFSMCRLALAPCSPFSVTTELLRQTVSFARKNHLRCHTHLAETMDENDFCLQTHGMRPLQYMESVDWLGQDIWFAHGIHFMEEEIALLGETKTGIAHCPTSNLRLGSGIAHVPSLRHAGVPVGLAVDGSASNDSSNMLRELQMALLVHRIGTGVNSMRAADVLEMATLEGARVLGRDDIGQLAEGKAADVVLFDLCDIAYAGAMHDPVAALLFCGTSQKVHTSIINGQIVVDNGHLVRINEEAIYHQANHIAKNMVDKACKRTQVDYYQPR